MCLKTNRAKMNQSTPLLKIFSLKLQCTKDSLKNGVWKRHVSYEDIQDGAFRIILSSGQSFSVHSLFLQCWAM